MSLKIVNKSSVTRDRVSNYSKGMSAKSPRATTLLMLLLIALMVNSQTVPGENCGPKNCYVCNDNDLSKCVSCLPGFFLSGNGCAQLPVSTTQLSTFNNVVGEFGLPTFFEDLSDCESLPNNSGCKSCPTGFEVDEFGSCTSNAIASRFNNCLLNPSRFGFCLTCKAGFTKFTIKYNDNWTEDFKEVIRAETNWIDSTFNNEVHCLSNSFARNQDSAVIATSPTTAEWANIAPYNDSPNACQEVKDYNCIQCNEGYLTKTFSGTCTSIQECEFDAFSIVSEDGKSCIDNPSNGPGVNCYLSDMTECIACHGGFSPDPNTPRACIRNSVNNCLKITFLNSGTEQSCDECAPGYLRELADSSNTAGPYTCAREVTDDQSDLFIQDNQYLNPFTGLPTNCSEMVSGCERCQIYSYDSANSYALGTCNQCEAGKDFDRITSACLDMSEIFRFTQEEQTSGSIIPLRIRKDTIDGPVYSCSVDPYTGFNGCKTCSGAGPNMCLSCLDGFDEIPTSTGFRCVSSVQNRPDLTQQCPTGVIFYGRCIQACPSRYYKNAENVCIKSNCLCTEGTIDTEGNCSACEQDSYLFENDCVVSCEEQGDYMPDETTRSCIPTTAN